MAPSGFMALRGAAMAAMLAPAVARAEPAVRLDQAGPLPFTRGELAAAVALRAPLMAGGAGVVDVVVQAAAPGHVVVAAGDRRRDVAVGTLSGADAARVVAVMVVDVIESAPPRQPERRWSVALSSGAIGGVDAGFSLEPTLTLGWRLGEATRVVASAGYARWRAVDRAGDEVMSLSTVPIRCGIGARLGPVEAQAGALARLHTASARQAAAGVRPGGWAAVLWAIPVRAPVLPFLAVGTDVHPRRLELRIGGQPVLAAGYVAPWAAVGLAYGGPR